MGKPEGKAKIEGLDVAGLLGIGLESDVGNRTRKYSIEELHASFPNYALKKVIGAGGMGAIVLLAWQDVLDRFVAIKVLPDAAMDSASAARFHLEAKAMARLSHPNIVPIHDFGETRDGHLYIVMEFIEGRNLAEVLVADDLAPSEVLRIFSQVCAAVTCAHEHKTLHRDLKPSNILINHEGSVQVTDFGLAQMIDLSDETTGHAREVAGTVGYMSPEHRGGEVMDERSDIYSLGVLLHEMLSGKLPEPGVALCIENQPGLGRFSAPIHSALTADREKRFSSVADFAKAVTAADAPKRNRIAIAGALLAVVALLAFVVIQAQRNEPYGAFWRAVEKHQSLITAPGNHAATLPTEDGGELILAFQLTNGGFTLGEESQIPASFQSELTVTETQQLLRNGGDPGIVFRLIVESLALEIPDAFQSDIFVSWQNLPDDGAFAKACKVISNAGLKALLDKTVPSAHGVPVSLLPDKCPDFATFCERLDFRLNPSAETYQIELVHVIVYELLRTEKSQEHPALSSGATVSADFQLRSRAEVLAALLAEKWLAGAKPESAALFGSDHRVRDMVEALLLPQDPE